MAFRVSDSAQLPWIVAKAKLPDAGVPFGLHFSKCGLKDEMLVQLSGLKNVVNLSLNGNDLTDAGLRELGHPRKPDKA